MIPRGRGGSRVSVALLVKLEPLLMEACVVLRAATALDLGANEDPPSHDQRKSDGNTYDSHPQAAARTREELRGAALLDG